MCVVHPASSKSCLFSPDGSLLPQLWRTGNATHTLTSGVNWGVKYTIIIIYTRWPDASRGKLLFLAMNALKVLHKPDITEAWRGVHGHIYIYIDVHASHIMFWLYIYVGTCGCSTFRLCRSPGAKSTSNHADKEEKRKQATGGPPAISQEYDLLLIGHRIVLIMVWSFKMSAFIVGIRQVWDTELSWYSLMIFYFFLSY